MRKGKLGRPRKLNVIREPNGRVSRAKRSPQEMAIRIRAQKFNLTFEQAQDPKSQSWIGRLCFLKNNLGLSENQYKAAEHYLKLYNNYRKAILSPSAHYEEHINSTASKDEKEYEQWVERAKIRFKHANDAIQKAQFDNPHDNLCAAMQYGVLEDLETSHLLGALRIALNALHHHFFATTQYHIHKKKKITLAGKKYADVNMILIQDNSNHPLRAIRRF